MSRISRYQDTVDRFLRTKSCISKNNIDNIEFIEKNIEKNEHICAVLLLTILNSHAKKNNLKIHGYFIACGLDILYSIVDLLNNRTYSEELYGKDKIKNICTEFTACVYKSLAENIDAIKLDMKQHTLKINLFCFNYLNSKIYDILKYDNLLSSKKMIKSDILTLKYKNEDAVKNKLKKMFVLDKDIVMKKIETTYGYTCQCALVLGSIMGGVNLNDINYDQTKIMIITLEQLGIYLGNMLKICRDYDNIENDILIANKTTSNIVVNIGLEESFIIFMESKTLFISGCLSLGIYSNTTKEIIDLIENKIDKCIVDANIDMKSKYSSFTT